MRSSEKANLPRIRDNQRRSRARRKEYLQELELRLRSCERQGVEASSEIQTVARRVVEENKILRALLSQQGIRDETIEAHLPTPSIIDAAVGGHHENHGESAQLLEHLLSTPKECCTDGNNTSEGNGRGRCYGRDSSGSVTIPQYVWNQPQNSTGEIQQAGRAQYITSSGSTTSSATGHAMELHQRPVPAQGNILAPGSNPSSQNHQMFDYDHQFAIPNQSYSTLQCNSPNHQFSSIHSSGYVPTTLSPNVNNCKHAADMITTMAGIDHLSAVLTDLGCGPGMDCEVDNQLVFNVMDQYSGVGL